jgi:hypothetical protein
MVQKLKSRGLPIVVIQHSAESFPFLQVSDGLDGSLGCVDQSIVESLMIPFQMVMRNEFSDCVSQGVLTKQNHLF